MSLALRRPSTIRKDSLKIPMVDLALICRIFDPTPTDDLVTKRKQGIESLQKAWTRKKNVNDLLRLAAGVAEGLQDPAALPQAIAVDAITHLGELSPALIHKGHELEVAVCSAAAVLGWIESSSPNEAVPLLTSACVASALWCALSMQRPSSNLKLEELRGQVLLVSRNHVLACALSTRIRKAVPAFSVTLKEDEELSDQQLIVKIKTAADASFSALRENAIRDREETDLLWWVLSDYSETFERPFSALSPELRAIARALEISKLMRRLPTESHKHLALRQVPETELMTFSALVASFGSERSKVASIQSQTEIVAAFPRVFPLLGAISSDTNAIDEAFKLTLETWTTHVLLEACIATMVTKTFPET